MVVARVCSPSHHTCTVAFLRQSCLILMWWWMQQLYRLMCGVDVRLLEPHRVEVEAGYGDLTPTPGRRFVFYNPTAPTPYSACWLVNPSYSSCSINPFRENDWLLK